MLELTDFDDSKISYLARNKDNECICEYKGGDFIKLYNTLEEEWEDA